METVIHMHPVIDMDAERFYTFCQLNRDARMERNARRDVIVMAPTGGQTSRRNAEIIMQLGHWTKQIEDEHRRCLVTIQVFTLCLFSGDRIFDDVPPADFYGNRWLCLADPGSVFIGQ